MNQPLKTMSTIDFPPITIWLQLIQQQFTNHILQIYVDISNQLMGFINQFITFGGPTLYGFWIVTPFNTISTGWPPSYKSVYNSNPHLVQLSIVIFTIKPQLSHLYLNLAILGAPSCIEKEREISIYIYIHNMQQLHHENTITIPFKYSMYIYIHIHIVIVYYMLLYVIILY